MQFAQSPYMLTLLCTTERKYVVIIECRSSNRLLYQDNSLSVSRPFPINCLISHPLLRRTHKRHNLGILNSVTMGPNQILVSTGGTGVIKILKIHVWVHYHTAWHPCTAGWCWRASRRGRQWSGRWWPCCKRSRRELPIRRRPAARWQRGSMWSRWTANEKWQTNNEPKAIHLKVLPCVNVLFNIYTKLVNQHAH